MSVRLTKPEDRIITRAILEGASTLNEEEICLKADYLKKLCPLIEHLFKREKLDCSSLEKSKGVEEYYKFRSKLVELFVGSGLGVLPKDQAAKIIINENVDLMIELINSMNEYEEEVSRTLAERVMISRINYDDYDEEDDYGITDHISSKRSQK